METATVHRIGLMEKTLVGTSVCLVPLRTATRFFPGYRRRGLLKLLRALRVPILCGKEDEFFNLYSLEEVLHYLTRPNGPGFVAPGSRFKNACYHKHPELGCTKLAVTEQDLEAIASPLLQRQRRATGLNAYSPRRSPSSSSRRPPLSSCSRSSSPTQATVVAGQVLTTCPSFDEGETSGPGQATLSLSQGQSGGLERTP